MADLDMKVFIGMNRVLKAITRATDKVHKQYGLTSGQFAVLEVLLSKGPMSVGQVQNRILTTSGNMPVIVKNLEKRQLITTHPDKHDARKRNLQLTDAGRTLIAEVFPQNERVIKEHLAVFSSEEQALMVRCFMRFGGNKWNDL